MITTVTLNATLDKTCFLVDLQLGRVNRVPVMHCTPGGKGVNAARVAHQLGCPVLATGFVAGFNGSFIETELAKQGILHDFVRVKGESRVSLNIIDRFKGLTTEILEHGPSLGQDDVLAIKDKIRQVASYSSVIAISGSIPEGGPVDLYADFIEIAHQEGAKTVLDASGAALVAGIEAVPTCIKPNELEMAELLGKPVMQDGDIFEGVGQLMRKGISCVAVSLGSRGAIVGMEGLLYRVHAPEVNAVNVVGCGDAFVGALCSGLYKHESMMEMVRLAVASGTANALTDEAGNIRLNDVKSLLGKVEIEEISG